MPIGVGAGFIRACCASMQERPFARRSMAAQLRCICHSGAGMCTCCLCRFHELASYNALMCVYVRDGESNGLLHAALQLRVGAACS
eukprot:4771860-Amphidinium_carterae.1